MQVDANGDTALLYIARAGHYKFKPSEIPAALLKAGANKEAKDSKGLTALQVSLLAGWWVWVFEMCRAVVRVGTGKCPAG